MNIAIIGGGWVGCHLAVKLKNTNSITLYEKNKNFYERSVESGDAALQKLHQTPTPVTARDDRSVENGNKPKEQPPAALQNLTPTPVTPRAFGGPVSMNRPYLVGEQGPEIFSPPRSGTITPNLEIQKAAADGVSAAGKDSQTLETISTQLARHGQLLEQMIKVQSDGSQAATGYLKRISMN